MSEVKYPLRMTSIYNDGKNNIQSNYSGINAVKGFNDFAERNKLKWAILIDESNGKIIDSFNCHPDRDTYRDLCAELLEQLKYIIDSSFGNLTREDSAAAQLMIDRASKILGDSNAT